MVDEEEMAATLKALPLEEAADHLLKMALDNGGRDNVSLMLLKVAEVAQ